MTVVRHRLFVPVTVVLVVWTLTTHGKYSTSGDEPHYLIVAESLVADGDLDLENNYRDGDARWFGVTDLEAGRHARRTPGGALWSVHDIGVPVVIAPVYAVATRLAARVPEPWLRPVRQTPGLFAYSLVSLALVVGTAYGAALLAAGLRRRTSHGRAAAVALVVTLSPPVLGHAFLVFPETIAFVVVCACVWVWCLDAADVTPRRAAMVLVAAGCLPWLHRKYSPLLIGLLVLLAIRHWPWFARQTRMRQMVLVALATVPSLVFHGWSWQAWGNVGGPHMLDHVPFSWTGLPRGALGLLFDRERGLVAYAPIYLLAPACVALAWRESRTLLIPIAAFFLPMAAFVTWDAGFSPAARFLVPLVPLVAAAVGDVPFRPRVRVVAAALVAAQVIVNAVAWQSPRLLWPREEGWNDLLATIPVAGPAYARLLPSLHTGDPVSAAWPVLLVAGLVALAAKDPRRL